MSDGAFRDGSAAVERAARLEAENVTLRAELAALRAELEAHRRPDNTAAVQRRLVEEQNELRAEVVTLREEADRLRQRVRSLERQLKHEGIAPGSPADWVLRWWRGTSVR